LTVELRYGNLLFGLVLIGGAGFLCFSVYETHTKRVADFLISNPGLQPRQLSGREELRQSMDRLQKLKADFRLKAGLSKGELVRLSGRKGEDIDKLYGILLRRFNLQSATSQ
jgi:hypothetical protein